MSDSKKPALVGIDPHTRKVVMIGIRDERVALDMFNDGLIVVPTTMEAARTTYPLEQPVGDIFATFCRGDA